MFIDDKNIVLTGFMGVGKSTVGKLVAQRLNREFVDTDTLIEQRYKKSIHDFFVEGNEHLFRAAESQLCTELSQQKNLVIATGGGTLVPYKNFKILSDNAHSFLLKAPFGLLVNRIKNSHRPLSQCSPEELLDLFHQRTVAYNRIAHHVDTKNNAPEIVAENIIQKVQLQTQFQSIMVAEACVPHHPSYPVCLQKNLLRYMHNLALWAGLPLKHVHIVSDSCVWSIHKEYVMDCFQVPHVSLSIIPNGENYKNIETIEKLYAEFCEHNVCRDTLVVAVGGGAVLDIAGFAVATYMRGVLKHINIPTTLLAMVDASLGGKTGVNVAFAKNLVGAFKHPQLMLIDPYFLESLDRDEYQAAFAEIIKHAVLADKDMFDAMLCGSTDIEELIKKSITIKNGIVKIDPFDTSDRYKLNLGHTFGHAIEYASKFTIKHGYAVALGMVIAAELSFMLQKCSLEVVESIKAILVKNKLPTRTKNVEIARVIEGLSQDKKRGSEALFFVLPTQIGDVEIVADISIELIEKALRKVIFLPSCNE